MQELFPRLRDGVPISELDGNPSSDFILKWQNVMTLLESVPEIQAALAAVTTDTSIANSYVDGLTLEAFNDGATCHVDISDHTRVYGDGTSVSVTGGTISLLAHDTVVRVYYDQASRAGGAVTYQWTDDATTAAQTGNRHSVGATVTPRTAEMDTVVGGGASPPGYAIP